LDIDKNKKVLIPLLLAIITIVLGWLLYINFSNKNRFFIVFDNVSGLHENSPVFINGETVGKILEMEIDIDKTEQVILEVKLDRDINIPDKSYAEIVSDDEMNPKTGIYIRLVASIDYLNPGDTIAARLNSQPIDSLIHITSKAKENLKKSIANLKDEGVIEPVASLENLVFKVQFMVSEKDIPLGSDVFKDLNDVEKYRENSYFKYVAGKFTNLSDAGEAKSRIRDIGFTDAFVVAFYNGKRISIEQALSLMN
jgi:hypothetical protein